MADTHGQNALLYGFTIAVTWFILYATILQYGLNLPVMCWECYLDWNQFWERFWVTLPAFFGSLPIYLMYFVLRYKWA